MAESVKRGDARDEIVAWLAFNERDLGWLANKTGIKYHALYPILIQQTVQLSDDKLKKINEVLETDFKK